MFLIILKKIIAHPDLKSFIFLEVMTEGVILSQSSVCCTHLMGSSQTGAPYQPLWPFLEDRMLVILSKDRGQFLSINASSLDMISSANMENAAFKVTLDLLAAVENEVIS